MAAKTGTERARLQRKRAARIIGGVTLDAAHAAKLNAILAATGENAAAWIRRMIREHAGDRSDRLRG